MRGLFLNIYEQTSVDMPYYKLRMRRSLSQFGVVRTNYFDKKTSLFIQGSFSYK